MEEIGSDLVTKMLPTDKLTENKAEYCAHSMENQSQKWEIGMMNACTQNHDRGHGMFYVENRNREKPQEPIDSELSLYEKKIQSGTTEAMSSCSRSSLSLSLSIYTTITHSHHSHSTLIK